MPAASHAKVTHLDELHPVSPVTSQFLHTPARAVINADAGLRSGRLRSCCPSLRKSLNAYSAANHSTRWPPVGFLEGIVQIVNDDHVVVML